MMLLQVVNNTSYVVALNFSDLGPPPAIAPNPVLAYVPGSEWALICLTVIMVCCLFMAVHTAWKWFVE